MRTDFGPIELAINQMTPNINNSKMSCFSYSRNFQISASFDSIVKPVLSSLVGKEAISS